MRQGVSIAGVSKGLLKVAPVGRKRTVCVGQRQRDNDPFVLDREGDRFRLTTDVAGADSYAALALAEVAFRKSIRRATRRLQRAARSVVELIPVPAQVSFQATVSHLTLLARQRYRAASSHSLH